VPVRGDALRRDASGSLGRAEEGPGRRHIAVLAQHGVDKVAVVVDGPIQIRRTAFAAKLSKTGLISKLAIREQNHLGRRLPFQAGSDLR
jgi:hypothetical protein